jgi:hypothetical protein
LSVCSFINWPVTKQQRRALKNTKRRRRKTKQRVGGKVGGKKREREREKKQQHDENNEAKCVDDDLVSFFLLSLHPLSLLRVMCPPHTVREERERATTTTAKCTGPSAPCVLSIYVCVCVLLSVVLLAMANGNVYSAGPIETWTLLKGSSC